MSWLRNLQAKIKQCGLVFGHYTLQIKSKTKFGVLVKIPCQPKQTCFGGLSLITLCVIGVRQPLKQHYTLYGSAVSWMGSGLMQASGVGEERLHSKALRSWSCGLCRIKKMQSCLQWNLGRYGVKGIKSEPKNHTKTSIS